MVDLDERDDRPTRLLNDDPSSWFTWDTDAQWWEAVSFAWSMQHNPSTRLDVWWEIFGSDRPDREAMMTVPERTVWSRLPEVVTLYRGGSGPLALGMSWTLRPHIALFFAGRCREIWGGRPWMFTAEVSREHVVAVLLERHEVEALVLPKHVEVQWEKTGWLT